MRVMLNKLITFGILITLLIGLVTLKQICNGPIPIPTPLRPAIEVFNPRPQLLPDDDVVTSIENGEYVKLRIPSIREEPEAVLVIENDSTRTQVLATRPVERFFPDFRRPRARFMVLGDTGRVTTIYQPRPLFELTIRPTIGVATDFESVQITAGATFLRIWGLSLGANVGVDPSFPISDMVQSATVTGHVGTDLYPHLHLSAGLSTQGVPTIGLQYRF